MGLAKRKTRLAGTLIIAGMAAGIFSVVPAIDSSNYLTEAAANSTQVIIGAIFQFIMALCYMGFAILLYPLLNSFGKSLSLGFFGFRILSAALVIFGTILLLAIFALSQEFVSSSAQKSMEFKVIGNVLKTTRDSINHIFMVLALCVGNLMFYILLIRSKLIPKWLSIWGVIGTLLAASASILLLFRIVEVITIQYVILNVPIAILELTLGIWLMVKGFDNKSMSYE